ncbi:MAG: DUF6745 domain-containing protein [Solirubrobacterales bacterium]
MFPREALGVEYPTDASRCLDLHAELAQSANWWWPCEDFIMCSERPEHVSFDADLRLHDETGAAVRYPDGWGVYAWHGVRVTREIIAGDFTATDVMEEANAETRRVMMEIAAEKHGAKWLTDGLGAKAIAVDENVHEWSLGVPDNTTATLWNFGDFGDDDGRPRVMVEVTNGSLESDGTRKQYIMRVPPDVRTPREAVAALNHPDLTISPTRDDVIEVFGEGAEGYVEVGRT